MLVRMQTFRMLSHRHWNIVNAESDLSFSNILVILIRWHLINQISNQRCNIDRQCICWLRAAMLNQRCRLRLPTTLNWSVNMTALSKHHLTPVQSGQLGSQASAILGSIVTEAASCRSLCKAMNSRESLDLGTSLQRNTNVGSQQNNTNVGSPLMQHSRLPGSPSMQPNGNVSSPSQQHSSLASTPRRNYHNRRSTVHPVVTFQESIQEQRSSHLESPRQPLGRHSELSQQNHHSIDQSDSQHQSVDTRHGSPQRSRVEPQQQPLHLTNQSSVCRGDKSSIDEADTSK